MKYQSIDAFAVGALPAPENPVRLVDSSLVQVDTPFLFGVAKRGFDVLVSLALLPLMALCAVMLLLANRIGNPGPLFYVQTRMGRDCEPIRVIKFRSMLDTTGAVRGADDPLETDRITPLGRFIRKTRIDELPQILNVLRGEMSLVGPRPDYFPHALYYLATVPGYRSRHRVLPGITGLAQVRLGYAEGIEATRAKVEADHVYVRAQARREGCYLMEIMIVLATIGVVLRGSGH